MSPIKLIGLTNRRGAVLLLTVYFASLVLLILGGISLQRTMIETRASQVSRNKQQAFYLAEGALDVTLTRLQTTNVTDGDYGAADQSELPILDGLPTNTEITLTTINTQVVNQTTQAITRTIAATGDALGVSSTVTATVSSTGPVKGVWTKGPIWIHSIGLGSGTGLFQGDLRSALGIRAAIKLSAKVDHRGALQIGPNTVAPTENFTLTGDDGDGDPTAEIEYWLEKLGTDNWDDMPGVFLLTSMGKTPKTTSDPPAIALMLPPPAVVSPYTAAECSGNISLTTNGQKLTITDGNLDPKDLSPKVGEIVLCLQYLQNDAPGSKVTFEAPATVYLTGENAAGYAVQATDLYTIHPGYLVPDTAPLTPSGLKLIVTKASGSVAGTVHLNTKRFAGSIYAPESVVYFLMPSNGEYRLENIVARETEIYTSGQPLAVDNGPAEQEMAETDVTIQSWSSN